MNGFPLHFSLFFLLFVTGEFFPQTGYDPDTGIRNEIRRELWQDLKTRTPKNLRALMGLAFSTNKPFKDYEKAAQKRGWPSYEMYTAATFFTIVLQETLSESDYSPSEVDSLYMAMYERYTTDAVDRELNADARQEKYDVLILKAYWIGSMFELAKKNNPDIQELASQLLVENDIPGIGTEKGNALKMKASESAGSNPINKLSSGSRKTVGSAPGIKDIILTWTSQNQKG